MKPERGKEPVALLPSTASVNHAHAVDRRDAQGRFLTGNSGGGRPRGSRNKLGEDFIEAFFQDWSQHGPSVLARVREDDPSTYLRITAGLIPRRLEHELSGKDGGPIDIDLLRKLSDEDFAELARIFAVLEGMDASK